MGEHDPEPCPVLPQLLDGVVHAVHGHKFHPGPVPEREGLFLCAGMSRQGFKLAPAIGRGVGELLTKGRHETIDLTPCGPDRFAKGRALTSLVSMKIAA